MEFALYALSIYAAVLTVLHVKQNRNSFDKVREMQLVIDASDNYIKKLTAEAQSYKEELRIERSIKKAQAVMLRRVQETLSPASFDITGDEAKPYDTQDYRVADNEIPAKHAPEELTGSFN